MKYRKKNAVDLDCPLRLTLSILGSKWKSCILDELRSGRGLRPHELHKALPEASPRVLDIQLKELVEADLVAREVCSRQPPHSRYLITDLGKSLLPIIDLMLQWGEEHLDHFLNASAGAASADGQG